MIHWVTLSRLDMAMVAHYVGLILVNKEVRGIRNTNGGKEERQFSNRLLGSMAECAVAQFFNLNWKMSLEADHVDVGGLIEVRMRREQHHHLYLARRDDDLLPYVLVHVALPRCGLIGWVWGREGKRDEWWADGEAGRPAFWVPNTFPPLRPIAELVEYVKHAHAATIGRAAVAVDEGAAA